MTTRRARRFINAPLPTTPPEGDPAGGGGGTGTGTGEPPAGGGNEPPAGGGGTGEPPAPRTFTQDEVTSIATREKNEGKRAGVNEFLAETGLKPDEAAAALKAWREAEDAKKTQEQRDREAAERQRAENERAAADLARERFEMSADRALMAAGISAADVDETKREATLARRLTAARAALGLGADATAEQITSAVATLKTDEPLLFGATGQGDEPPSGGAPSSMPGGTAPAPRRNADAKTRGAERAKDYNERRGSSNV